jgi:hypothetical protein
MVHDAAWASASRDWSEASAEERPRYPLCGTPLVARGKNTRRLHTQGEQDIALTRSSGVCPTYESGRFPLDEHVGLVPGCLTPGSQHQVGHLAIWMPCRRAVQMWERVTGVQIREATARRQTERVGEAVQAVQQVPPTHQATSREGADTMVVNPDGAMVPLVSSGPT